MHFGRSFKLPENANFFNSFRGSVWMGDRFDNVVAHTQNFSKIQGKYFLYIAVD